MRGTKISIIGDITCDKLLLKASKIGRYDLSVCISQIGNGARRTSCCKNAAGLAVMCSPAVVRQASRRSISPFLILPHRFSCYPVPVGCLYHSVVL